jgi:hypothetical protein
MGVFEMLSQPDGFIGALSNRRADKQSDRETVEHLMRQELSLGRVAARYREGFASEDILPPIRGSLGEMKHSLLPDPFAQRGLDRRG